MKHVLTTTRLSLVPFGTEDQSIFQELNTDPFICKYMWDGSPIDMDTAKEVISANKKLFDDHDYGIWKVFLKSNHELIGYAGLWYFFDEPQPQLIYALLESLTKQGLATEAAKAIIDHAFSNLGFDYLIAATDKPHTASQKVATRLGMKFVEERLENGKPTLFYRIEK